MNLTRAAKMSFLVFVCFLVSSRTLSAQSLKVPYVSVSPTNGPLWIAKEARLFNKYNLPDVQLIYIPGGTVIIQSMIAGEANIANMAPPAALAAWVKGADFAVVGSAVNRLLETVVTPTHIKSPRILRVRKSESAATAL